MLHDLQVFDIQDSLIGADDDQFFVGLVFILRNGTHVFSEQDAFIPIDPFTCNLQSGICMGELAIVVFNDISLVNHPWEPEP